MKKTIYNATLLTALSLSGLSTWAQNDMSAFLKTGISDGNKLVNAYANPLLKSLGAGMNSGWFNTAKPHGLAGFDLTIVPAVAFAPSSDKSFNVNDLGLQALKVTSGNPKTATFLGTDKSGPEVGLYAQSPYTGNDTAYTFSKLPGGIGVGAFPVPAAQLAIGLIKGTEVVVRFLPQINYGDMKMGMLGFGVKHDIKQWIPVMKELPFDLSVMFNYSMLDATLKVKALTADPASNTTYNGSPGRSYNQNVEFDSKAYAFNAIISKKIAMFTPYLGVGFQASNTTMKMKGDYPITDVNLNFEPNNASGTPGYDPNNPNHHPKIVRVQTDPVTVEGKLSGMRATGGFRLKMAVITIQADYTFAQYNVLTFGIGVNIQALAPFKL